jgi:hypothetical protein
MGDTIKNSIVNIYNLSEGMDYVDNLHSPELQYENIGNFSRYCKVDFSEDVIEVPCFAFQTLMYQKNRYSRIQNWAIQLSVTEPFVKSTSDSIIKEFFTRSYFPYKRLRTIKTKKDEYFYGNKGLIFDNTFTPLLFTTISFKNNKEFEVSKLEYLGFNVYINPKVFIEQDNIVSKAIIKKMMPVFLTTDSHIKLGWRQPVIPIKTNVIIADISKKFFCTTKTPDINTISDEYLNKLIAEEIDNNLI